MVDGGAELHCFSSDVTRTWPVNGKFSAAQREIYNAVLEVQKACIDACTVGKTINQLHTLSTHLTAEKLRRLGILNSRNNVCIFFILKFY